MEGDLKNEMAYSACSGKQMGERSIDSACSTEEVEK